MVNLKRLGDRAKDLVEKRGGTDSLKRDATELKDIARGQGSLSDKAKAAAAALKDPGHRGEAAEPQAAPAEPSARGAAEAKRKQRAQPRTGGGNPA